MRNWAWFAGLFMGLLWSGAAHAQQSASLFKFPKTLNINVTPSITNNSPMDYRNQNAPIGGTYYTPNTTGTPFPYKIASMFYSPSRTNYIASTTTAGHSIFPTPAQMHASAPSYLKPFQMYRGQFIQP